MKYHPTNYSVLNADSPILNKIDGIIHGLSSLTMEDLDLIIDVLDDERTVLDLIEIHSRLVHAHSIIREALNNAKK